MKKRDLESTQVKWKIVYAPFLILAICYPLIFSLLRWVVDFTFNLSFYAFTWEFILPLALLAVPLYKVMWHRLALLKPLSAKGLEQDVRGQHFGLMYIFIIATTMALQSVLPSAYFEVVPLHSAAELDQHPNERYFSLEEVKLDTNSRRQHASTHIRKHRRSSSQTLSIQYSVVERFQGQPHVWLGTKYVKSINNRLTQDQKRYLYNVFMDSCEQKYSRLEPGEALYFERPFNKGTLEGFHEAIVVPGYDFDPKKETVLVAKFEPFKPFGWQSLGWSFGFFVIGQIFIISSLAIRGVHTNVKSKLLAVAKSDARGRNEFLSLFDPRGSDPIMSVLLLINVGLYLIMIISGVNFFDPDPMDMLNWGGLRRYEVGLGQKWRFLTAPFLHAGILHLLNNMIALVLFAGLLEGVLGSWRFLLHYLLFGLFAGLTSIVYHPSIAVGASGAIYGLMGMLAVFNAVGLFPNEQKSNWYLLAIFGGIGLILGLQPGIDNAAHFGGLIAGALAGLFWVRGKESLKKLQSGAFKP